MEKENKDNRKLDFVIDALKRILSINPNDLQSRKKLIDCYFQRYVNHKYIKEYIEYSGLKNNDCNVFKAISDFEKHLALDVRSFVYHYMYGLGVIIRFEKDMLTVKFKKIGEKQIAFEIAKKKLEPLSKEHIWVIKEKIGSKSSKFKTKDDLVKEVISNKVWALKTIIKSFGNSCDLKKIGAELYPSILNFDEWISWSIEAEKLLNSDLAFDINPKNKNEYMVLDNVNTLEEKYLNRFNTEILFFNRVDILYKFIADDNTDKESGVLIDMIRYFIGSEVSIRENEGIVAYLVVQDVAQKFPNLAVQSKFTFGELFNKLRAPGNVFLSLKDLWCVDFREKFLENVKLLSDWEDKYIKIIAELFRTGAIFAIINSNKWKLEFIDRLFDDYQSACRRFYEKDPNKYISYMLSCDNDQMGCMYMFISDICEAEFDAYKIEFFNKRKKIMFYVEDFTNITFYFSKRKFFHFSSENDKPSTLRIYSVYDIDGSLLNSTWTRNNQIIITDKGLFIDNIPGTLDGCFKTAVKGYNWKLKIGKNITNFEIIFAKGYPWLKYPTL